MQCACAILSSVAVQLYNIFSHYLINGTVLGGGGEGLGEESY